MRVDWQRIANNFYEARGTAPPMEVISVKCGMSKCWLRNFRNCNMNSPNFEAGLKLLRLHLRAFGREKHREVIKK